MWYDILMLSLPVYYYIMHCESSLCILYLCIFVNRLYTDVGSLWQMVYTFDRKMTSFRQSESIMALIGLRLGLELGLG